MKGLSGEWQDLKDWTAYLIDLLSRGKRDVTALKVLIVLALIVVPGGILLQSSGGIFNGANSVLAPISSLFNGLSHSPAAGNTTEDHTHTGVFDPSFKPTPYVWQGRTDTPSGSQQGNTTPTPTLSPNNGTSPTPTTGPTANPTSGPTAVPTPVPQDHITVHVKDDIGTAIVNALVRIGSLSGSTDSSGNIGFTLNDGTAVTIQVSATGYDSNSITYTPTPGGVATVTLSLTVIPQDQIMVHVQDGSGPIANAQVTIDSQSAFTNATGNADFTLDHGVPVTVQASAAGHYSNSVSYTPAPGGIATISLTSMPVPTASFTATPISGDAPLSVQFTDTSNDHGVSISSWHWNFGDTVTSSLQNPGHIYSSAGTYTVTLTVTNAGGSNTCTYTNYITVTTPAPTPTPAPVADFTMDASSGTAPLTVHFTDRSSNVIAWSWDFGDGQTDISQNPTHIYANPGPYTVTLTVTGLDGVTTSVKTDSIVVTPISDHITFHVIDSGGLAIPTATVTIGGTSLPVDSNGDVTFTLYRGILVHVQVTDPSYAENDFDYTPNGDRTEPVTLS